jgi:thymidylate synthase
MTKIFSSSTRIDVWLQASEYLLEVGHDLNVILSISSPGSDGAPSAAVRARIDAFYSSEQAAPLHTVAETIFPGWEYRHRGLQGVFDTYATEYQILKNGDPRRWGTYAHRLLHRQTAGGQTVNPLGVLIEKMRSEREQQRRGPFRSCYEIGVAEGEYDLPLYNTVDDQHRRLGLPCLSHLSFKLYDESVHLTAIYRSHDYRYKVPGNLLGLARLQACVAHEVGIPMGTLVVHSTYAYLDLTKGKTAFKKLIGDLRGLVTKESINDMAD